MTQTADEALAAASFESDGQEYRLVRLPANATTAAAGVIAQVSEPFCAMVVDGREVSLILPGDAVKDFQGRLPDMELAGEICRLITVNVEMEPEMTGLVARIAEALAAASVPVLPFASFSRDHFLVPAQQLDAALAALNQIGGQPAVED